MALLVDKVGALARELELGAQLVFGDLGFPLDRERPALVEGAVGLGLELFEERGSQG